MLAGELQRQPCPERADLERLDGELEIARWARGACKVHHRVDPTGHGNFTRDVALDERERVVVPERREVPLAAGHEVVERDNLVASREQAFDEVRAEKSGAARYDDSRHYAALSCGDATVAYPSGCLE